MPLEYLLKQDGDYLLLQSGDKLELQSSVAALGPQFQKGEVTQDAQYRALLVLGYDGPVPEMLMEWLAANGAATATTLPEAWSEMLASKGYGYPYSLQKAWELVLIDQGFSGTLAEMEREFWVNGGTFV